MYAQLDGLKSYFLSCDEAETVKVKKIIDTRHNPLTRLILQFLSKSQKRILLYQEMSRLVHLYASNRLKIDVIIAAKNNLSTLNLASGGHLADEKLR